MNNENKDIFKRLVLFFAILIFVLLIMSGLAFVSMRGMYNYEPFYEIKEDTVDVVFVGSSFCYCAFSPIRLYDQTGLSSQVFGSSNQSCAANYLWAKEAYSKQKYKVLVFEVGSFMNPYGEPKRNIAALNSMKKGKNYFELVKVHGIKGLHVFFPVFYYHDLWKNINRNSFEKYPNQEVDTFRGFYPLGSHYVGGEIRVIESEYENNTQLELEYVDKLLSFCRENDIIPIFVKTATATDDSWNAWWYGAVATYAETNGVDYIDFNSREYLDAADIKPEDIAEDGCHLSISGAHKLTDFIGKYLLERGDISFDLYDSDDEMTEERIASYYSFMDKVRRNE